MSPQRKVRQCLTAVSVLFLCALIAPVALAESDTHAMLSGYLYVDWNHDLARDGGDFLIGNAVVQLFKEDDLTHLLQLVSTVETDALGLYTFADLNPGKYTIHQLSCETCTGFEALGTLVGTDAQGKPVTLNPGTVVNSGDHVVGPLKNVSMQITIPATSDTGTPLIKVVGANYDVGTFSYPISLVSKRFLMDKPTPTPEPGTLGLLVFGGLAAGLWAWRRRAA
jgi:hypothetical protein